MLSQTKMQLWYPKKPSSEESPNSNPTFLNKYAQKVEKLGDFHSPAMSDVSGNGENEEINVEFLSEDDSSRVQTPVVGVERKRKRVDEMEVSGFVDLDYWKRETICCGTIFRGLYDEVLVDARFFKPCSARRAKMELKCVTN